MAKVLEGVYNVYSMFASGDVDKSNLLSLADNELLKVANELNTIFDGDFNIELPNIVVVGSQSTGKSSTLNGLLGMNILPTGKQIVTRTPVNMRLVHTNEKICTIEFYELKGGVTKVIQTFKVDPINYTESDIYQIQDCIGRLTEKYAGKQKNIVNRPIMMNIYSPNVPNLVLTDLPGLVKIPLKEQGQPDDLSSQVEKMISYYISKEKCIIMSIVPSNIDIEVDAGIALVKKHDPEGKRTLGVFTKADLAGKEHNINNYVDGIIDSNLKVKYGYYAVKNVTKSELEGTKHTARSKEEEFFKSSSFSGASSQDRLGIYNLGISLSNILISSIKEIIPELIEKIRETEKEIDKQLEDLGLDFPTDNKGKQVMINLLVAEFQKIFSHSIKERGTKYHTGTDLAKQYATFKLDVNNLTPFSHINLPDSVIDHLVATYEGIHMPSSTTSIGVLELCFSGSQSSKKSDLKSKSLVDRLEPVYIVREPFYKCIKEVQSILISLVDKILFEDKYSRFPNLVMKIRNVITDMVMPEKYEETITNVNNFLKLEKKCIWVDDVQFADILCAEQKNVRDSIRNVLVGYHEPIKRILSHNIHKSIQVFFVEAVIDELSVSLLNRVFHESTEGQLLQENKEKADKRSHLLSVKEKICNAKKVIFQTRMRT